MDGGAWQATVCPPLDCRDSDTTEQLHFHFSLDHHTSYNNRRNDGRERATGTLCFWKYIYIHIFFFSISLLNFCKDSVNLSVKVSLKLNLLIFKNNFIYLFMAVLSLHCCVGFSFSCTEQGTTLILHCSGFSYFGAQAPGSQASAVAFWHMGSSLIRDGNHVSSINRQILYH